MEENSMIRMEEVKERKVEVVKDVNSATESEKEIIDKKEQERKERICLIQLIVIFCTWVFLIILLMRNERIDKQKPKAPAPKPKVANTKPPAAQTKKVNPTAKNAAPQVKATATPAKKEEKVQQTKTNEEPKKEVTKKK